MRMRTPVARASRAVDGGHDARAGGGYTPPLDGTFA